MKEMMQRAMPLAAVTMVLILLLAFHALPPKHSTGFFVKLAPARCPAEDDSDADRLIILRLMNTGTTYINFEQVPWNNLQTVLSEIYTPRLHRTLHLAAEDGVPFQTVADALDVVHGTRSYVPTQGRNYLGITVKLVTPAALNAPCPEPYIPDRNQPTPR